MTTPQIVTFYDELIRHNRSSVMVRKILTSLKGILSEAQTRGMIGANVALPVKIGGVSREDDDVTIPTKAEVRALVELANKWVAMPWTAFSMKAGSLEVFQRADEKGKIGPPKSKAGNRVMYLSTTLSPT